MVARVLAAGVKTPVEARAASTQSHTVESTSAAVVLATAPMRSLLTIANQLH
jgi:hypothetical protein